MSLVSVQTTLNRAPYDHMVCDMASGSAIAQKVTMNLPAELLAEAQAVTGEGITETVKRGLELVRRSGSLDKARALRGRLSLDVDLEVSRERRRR